MISLSLKCIIVQPTDSMGGNILSSVQWLSHIHLHHSFYCLCLHQAFRLVICTFICMDIIFIRATPSLYCDIFGVKG